MEYMVTANGCGNENVTSEPLFHRKYVSPGFAPVRTSEKKRKPQVPSVCVCGGGGTHHRPSLLGLSVTHSLVVLPPVVSRRCRFGGVDSETHFLC